MKRKRGVRLSLWLVICALGLAVSLVLADERVGGPLGRIYTGPEKETTIEAAVGDTILLSEGTEQNSTRLPFQILSVHSGTTYTSLTVKGGISANFGTDGNSYRVLKGSEAKVGGYRISFLHGFVRIPPSNRKSDKSQFTAALAIVPKHPGVYHINGILCTYRWGLFVYTARLNHTTYVLHVTGNTP